LYLGAAAIRHIHIKLIFGRLGVPELPPANDGIRRRTFKTCSPI